MEKEDPTGSNLPPQPTPPRPNSPHKRSVPILHTSKCLKQAIPEPPPPHYGLPLTKESSQPLVSTQLNQPTASNTMAASHAATNIAMLARIFVLGRHL